MDIHTHLFVHNIGALISLIISIALAIFVLFNNPRKTANIMMALANFAIAIFIASHLLGTNALDPHLSQSLFMFNLSVIFIAIFGLHMSLIILHKEKERRAILICTYALGIGLTIFYILFPNSFLMDSIPRMYFANYYVVGPLHIIFRIIFNLGVPLYTLFELISGYPTEKNPIEQNRIRYWTVTMIIGYVIGSLPIFLMFGIEVDPAWGIWFVPLYAVPLVYATITYELVDVRVIAKKAFLYGMAIVGVGGLITLFDFSNQFIRNGYPQFPFWITPFISTLVASAIALFVWKKLREEDILKYEFMTTVTHKFRTPLTHIKWAAENLVHSQTDEDRKIQLEYIQSANAKLVELTSLLMNVSETENTTYTYDIKRTDVSLVVAEAVSSLQNEIRGKNITIEQHLPPGMYAEFDSSRIKFIIQTFVENALHYAPDNTTVSVTTSRNKKDIVCSVRDAGIGIPKEEVPLLFSKFYRGKQAKLADTEGMGIGLFVAKQIITRHKGNIWAESEGLNKGSVFSFSLPAVTAPISSPTKITADMQ